MNEARFFYKKVLRTYCYLIHYLIFQDNLNINNEKKINLNFLLIFCRNFDYIKLYHSEYRNSLNSINKN